MSTTHFDAQDVSHVYATVYCVYANCALLVYDWFLCFDQEVRFIWNRNSKVAGPLLVYIFSRYALLAKSLLVIATNYPMSDLSCAADVWAQTIAGILGKTSFSVFSALRAYVLSDRNKWLAAVIILSALPPSVMLIIISLDEAPMNLPIPFNCISSSSLSPMFSLSATITARVSQLLAELLVIGITWRYTYQSFQMKKGIKMGETLSSFLIYNGCLYFLFLATIYSLVIILKVTLAPVVAGNADSPFDVISDSITSVLVCRFMLSLRQVNSRGNTPATLSIPGSPIKEHRTSTLMVLEFGAQPSHRLPPFIASFAQPVHVDSVMSDTDLDANLDDGSEWEAQDVVTLAGTVPSLDSSPTMRRRISEAVKCPV